MLSVKRRSRVLVASVQENGNVSVDDLEGLRKKCASFSYRVRHNGEDYAICMEAFLSIHSIGRKRLRRIQQLLTNNETSPKDKRGMHDNRAQKIPKAGTDLVHLHIKSLRKHQSHYSRRDNPKKYFSHENLTSVSQVYRLFVEEFSGSLVPVGKYREIFNTYNTSFGKPYTDTCSTSDSFSNTIVCDPTRREAVNRAKEAHLTLVNQFTDIRKKYENKAKRKRISYFSFDFMQNLPLPNLSTNDVYFIRDKYRLTHLIFIITMIIKVPFCSKLLDFR